MKITKIMIPVVASAMLLTGCDDQIMQWGKPGDHADVTTADLPLAVKEVIANYDNIKDYATQYTPGMLIGIGMGADLYTANANGEAELVNANYQLFTPGNAMKQGVMVGNSGAINFAAVDNLLDAMPEGMRLYGHNFFWHTQQNQSYLKSLIAPTLVVESTSDIQTIIKNGDFEKGDKSGWSSWGNDSETEVCTEAAKDGSYGIKLTNPKDGSDYHVAQLAYNLDNVLEVGKTYTIRFQAKSSVAGEVLQFCAQNSKNYAGEAYHAFTVGTSWTTCEYDYTVTKENMDRILLNFGKVAGTFLIDNVEFGIKEQDPMDNILADDACDFEGGTTGGWGSWGSNKESSEVVEGAGYKESYGLVLTNKGDGNAWEAQCAYTFKDYLEAGKKYIIQFYAKSSSAAGELQFQYQNGTTYSSQGGYNTFNIGTEWSKYEYEFTPTPEDVDRILINFGKVGATYYIDNIKFGLAKNQSSEAKTKKTLFRSNKRKVSSKMYYVLKTPEEKRTALLTAMESWVKGVADHLKVKNVVPYGYDVINEPIADGSNKVRGIDEGVFGGSWTEDEETKYDAEPTESVEDGLSLNWGNQPGNQHWYWGYYVRDYAVKAFQMARQYLPAETKLFVNDYNLETSPGKLAALIAFVNKIDTDNGSPIVDGIGTQMHVSLPCKDDAEYNAQKLAELKEKVDAMFQTMAATGKLVRVTELDIALNNANPSAAQYQAQSEAYRLIMESYKANVPAAQQSGITIWSLSDNEIEHEYWLKGDKPNLFDKEYKRKWAYKGFCDGIAGEDLGLKFGGDSYKAYYEKNNVSSDIK